MSAAKTLKSTSTIKSSKVISKPSAGLFGGLFAGLLGTSAVGASLAQNPLSKSAREIRNSIRSVPVGILFIVFGLFLTYTSVVSVKENSKIVAGLNVRQATQAPDSVKLGAFSGSPRYSEDQGEFKYSYKTCADSLCTSYLAKDVTVESIISYEAKVQRLEQIEKKTTKTVTRTENGQEIEEEIEETIVEEDWVTKSEDKEFAEIQLGKLKLDLTDVDIRIESEETTIENAFVDGVTGIKIIAPNGQDVVTSELGKTRIILETKSLPEQALYIGGIESSSVDGDSDLSIFTDQNKAELVDDLQSEESSSRFFMRAMAWLALTLGFMMVVGPILSVIKFIPLIGGAANTAAFIVGALVSLIIVFVGVFVVTYWWLVVLFFTAIILVGLTLLITRKPVADND